MPNKRYQIFISSTYRDLQEERRQALQALLNADYIPAGMELFPATDEEQFEYIKRVIDNCDYYLLIVGGCYGSIADDGRSYTEKEFDYACSKGIKVIALVHKDPSSLGEDRRETDPERKDKFDLFRQKVCDGRVVKMWSEPAEIQGHILAALKHATEQHPAIGWVRANVVASSDLIFENREFEKENKQLRIDIERLRNQLQPAIDNIVGLDGFIAVKYKTTLGYMVDTDIHLGRIFCRLSSYLSLEKSRDSIFSSISTILNRCIEEDINSEDCYVDSYYADNVLLQFTALGLIQEFRQNNTLFYELTEMGKKKMLEMRIMKK